MSDPSAVSSLRSSAPKNGANVLVLITSVPNGNSSRLTSPYDVSSTDPCSAIRVPSARSTAMPRAPTIRAIAGSTRSATSCSLVADISSPMASCIRRCSGRRQRSRRPFGGANPSMNATALNVARSPVTRASTESSSPPAAATTSAAVRAADATASISIRRRATVASVRPARHRRTATISSNTDQWMMKATT